MRWLALPAVLVLLMLSSVTSAQTAEDVAQVQRDVKTLIYALNGGDVDMVLRFTSPRAIELAGGVERVRQGLQAAVQLSRDAGMQIDSFEFPEPPDFVAGGGRVFAVVPTLQVVTVRGQKVESLNFQLGIREPGAKTWVYVEGSRLDQPTLQALAPGFPPDYDFPPVYRKRL